MRKLEVRATGSKRSGSAPGISRPGFGRGEEFGIGIAEEVDGLHGVADDETTAAFALGPGGDEAAEEFVLAAAGVLKLVDEQVVDAVGDGEGGVGGLAVGALEDVEGDLRDFNVVDCAGFGKDDAELAGGVAEQGETGADDLPVFVGVAGGGQGSGRRRGRTRGRGWRRGAR